MDASKFFQRWRRRLAKLESILPGLVHSARSGGEPEQIHQLRVVLRRMRLLVRLGEPVLGRRAALAFHDWSRDISDRVSRLRDYDVTLEWLEPQADARATWEHLSVRRARLWKLQRSRLTLPKLQLRSRIVPSPANHQQQSRMHKAYLKCLEKAVRQAQKSAPQFGTLSPPQQHEFRRRIRRWRYGRELGLAQRKIARDSALKKLIRLQDAVGNYQNRLVAASVLSHRDGAQHGTNFQALLAAEQPASKHRIQRPLQAVIHLVAQTSAVD